MILKIKQDNHEVHIMLDKIVSFSITPIDKELQVTLELINGKTFRYYCSEEERLDFVQIMVDYSNSK